MLSVHASHPAQPCTGFVLSEVHCLVIVVQHMETCFVAQQRQEVVAQLTIPLLC